MFKRATYLPALFIRSFLLKPKFIFNSPKEELFKEPKKEPKRLSIINKIDIFGYTIYEKYSIMDYIKFIKKINQKYFVFNSKDDFIYNLHLLNSRNFPIDLINLLIFYGINEHDFLGDIKNLSATFKRFILKKFIIEIIQINCDRPLKNGFSVIYKYQYGLKIINLLDCYDDNSLSVNKIKIDDDYYTFNKDELMFLSLIKKESKKRYLYSFFIKPYEYDKLIELFKPFKIRFFFPINQIPQLLDSRIISAINDDIGDVILNN
jgi:hypothetical protein